MAVVVGPGRKLGVNGENDTKPAGPTFICHPSDQTAATILISLGALGIGANLALMAVILLRRPLRRSVTFHCYKKALFSRHPFDGIGKMAQAF